MPVVWRLGKYFDGGSVDGGCVITTLCPTTWIVTIVNSASVFSTLTRNDLETHKPSAAMAGTV